MATDMAQPRTDWSGPGSLGGRMLRREAARWWWVPLITGVIWFIIAWLVLRANVSSLTTVGVLVGIAFLIAAANEAALGSLLHGGWRVAHYALGVLFVLGAIWAFVRPINTFFAIASMLGLLLFLQGIFYIAQSVALRDASPYWGLELFSGILVTALAIWVSVSDRVWDLQARAVFILLWVGLLAVFRGISDIGLAFGLMRVSRQGDAALERQAAGTPPYIPAQERRSADEARQQASSAPRG